MSRPFDHPDAVTTLEALDAAADLLRALSHATRLELLRVLEYGEAPVGDIARALGVAQPTVSRHLAVLYGAGLVQRRRDGHYVRYRLAVPKVISLVTVAADVAGRTAVPSATRARHDH